MHPLPKTLRLFLIPSRERGLIQKIFLIFTFLFVSACAPSQKKIQSLPNLSEQSQIKSDFLAYLNAFEGVNSFQGLAEIKLKTRGRAYSATEVLQIRLPHRFSLESLDDLGGLLFLLKSDGEQLLLQDVQAQKKRVEKLSPHLLRQFLPFQTSIAQTLGLLFGKLILPPETTEPGFARFAENPNQVWISWASTRYLWDEEFKRVTVLETYQKNRLLFRYEASNFEGVKVKNIALPHKIWLKDFAQGSEMGLHYSNMEINVEEKPGDAAFEILP
ncbi:MAG: hypothetical protein HQM15_06495 [Deltaproteobacteria bacterium]|nr:hypothetical protein [Deltaproteobacteria bacterium]